MKIVNFSPTKKEEIKKVAFPRNYIDLIGIEFIVNEDGNVCDHAIAQLHRIKNIHNCKCDNVLTNVLDCADIDDMLELDTELIDIFINIVFHTFNEYMDYEYNFDEFYIDFVDKETGEVNVGIEAFINIIDGEVDINWELVDPWEDEDECVGDCGFHFEFMDEGDDNE